MKVLEKNNNIYFNLDDKSFANLCINDNNLKLELLETKPQFRDQHCASRLMRAIFEYIKTKRKFKKIYLNPLPLSRFGLKLGQLIRFYEKFGFVQSALKNRSAPHLMEKKLD